MNQYVIGLFSKGALGTALFVIVMYTGALKNGTKLTSELMKIRGELSIFAAILMLAHIVYGKISFKLLFAGASALTVSPLCIAIISMLLVVIMPVLTVTSFPQVRRKMNAKRWKQLHRTAYLFYGLIYIHVLFINIPLAGMGSGKYLFNVIVYSIAFIGYAVMRIRKYLLKKHSGKPAANGNL